MAQYVNITFMISMPCNNYWYEWEAYYTTCESYSYVIAVGITTFSACCACHTTLKTPSNQVVLPMVQKLLVWYLKLIVSNTVSQSFDRRLARFTRWVSRSRLHRTVYFYTATLHHHAHSRPKANDKTLPSLIRAGR